MMWCREVFVLSVLLMGYASPSAIPMWEFLSRGEKMSHLFNMFVKQVSSHCDTSTMPDCQKVLLVYGLTNLAKMEDDSLDQMDPYQRGATDIIWESMMKGGYKQSGQDGDNEKDEYDQFDGHTNGNQLGSQEEASSNVEEYAGAPPMGPMVVRLLPDGRPVPGDAQLPLPRDEDAEEYQAMRAKPVPSISDISSANHGQSIANYQSKPVASTTNYQNKPVSSAVNYQTKPVADISAANLHATSNANLQSQQQQRIQAARKL